MPDDGLEFLVHVDHQNGVELPAVGDSPDAADPVLEPEYLTGQAKQDGGTELGKTGAGESPHGKGGVGSLVAAVVVRDVLPGQHDLEAREVHLGGQAGREGVREDRMVEQSAALAILAASSVRSLNLVGVWRAGRRFERPCGHVLELGLLLVSRAGP